MGIGKATGPNATDGALVPLRLPVTGIPGSENLEMVDAAMTPEACLWVGFGCGYWCSRRYGRTVAERPFGSADGIALPLSRRGSSSGVVRRPRARSRRFSGSGHRCGAYLEGSLLFQSGKRREYSALFQLAPPPTSRVMWCGAWQPARLRRGQHSTARQLLSTMET